MVNLSGEYRVTCVADEDAASLGLTDKPCWRIYGPGGLEGVAWTWSRSPKKVLAGFLKELGLDE
jgi:hypothetical protein